MTLPCTRRELLRSRSGGKLTPREREVAALLAAGLSNPAITARLCISPNTLEHHLTSVYAKLGVVNRTQAALQAVQLGIGHSPLS
jgi:DNA-binding CsgD family transcriptional regulator